jgi:hypothetical protein
VTQVCQVHPFISEHEAQVALALCDNDAHRAECRLRSYSFLLKVRKVSQYPPSLMQMRFVRACAPERRGMLTCRRWEPGSVPKVSSAMECQG